MRADFAGEMPVFPRMIHMIVSIPTLRVSHPAIIFVVHVRSVRLQDRFAHSATAWEVLSGAAQRQVGGGVRQ
jgi:hypothetical protein